MEDLFDCPGVVWGGVGWVLLDSCGGGGLTEGVVHCFF